MRTDLEKQIDELKQRLKVQKAIEKVKLSWPGDQLSESEKMAVCKISDKYMGKGHSLGVLYACTIYKSDPNPKPKETVGAGRPKNSKDYPVKKLINQLAVIFERNEGDLPQQYQSKFGKMIEEIADALNVKDTNGNPVTWNGHVNEILKGKIYSRLRGQPTFQYRYEHFEDAVNAAEDDKQWRSMVEQFDLFSKVCGEGISQALKDISCQLEFESKIKEIPGSDSFHISVKKM